MNKITDINKIDELYRAGKISRSTWWRGRKRGWIKYEYHKPHTQPRKFSSAELHRMYRNTYKVVAILFNRFKKDSSAEPVLRDIVDDVFLYILERGYEFKDLKKVLGWRLLLHLYRKRPFWSQYLFIPDGEAHKGSRNREFSSNFDEF